MEKIVEFPGLGLHFSFKNYFSIGSLDIAFYGLIIAVGLFLAIVYAFVQFKKVGVDKDKAIDAIIGGIIGGIVGARIYYVIFAWDAYKENLWSIFDIRSGGLAIYGGIIGALAVGLLIAKWRKIKLRPLLDIVGIGFLLGQGIGRWGNFINVEAFGSNTTMPWGMTSPSITTYLQSKMSYFESIGVTVDPNMPVHPCFLYESIWCLIGFVVLHFYLKHRRFDGEVFLLYLGYYGLGRFFIEGLRTDSLMVGSLRVSQLLAGALFVASILAVIIIRFHIKGKNDGEYMKLFVETEEGQATIQQIEKKKILKQEKTIEADTAAIEKQEPDNKEGETNNG